MRLKHVALNFKRISVSAFLCVYRLRYAIIDEEDKNHYL